MNQHKVEPIEYSPLVPKLRFGNGMTLETPFPVKKQATRIYTRNKVSGVSVFPNRSLGTREKLRFPPRSQTEVWERNDAGNSVSSLEFGHKK